MIKQTITLLLILAAVSPVFAQDVAGNAIGDWNPDIYRVGQRYPGYIINLEGDTVSGFLEAQSRCSGSGLGASNQTQAVFYVHETDKKPAAKYKPNQLKGYKIADKVYESIPYSGGLLKKPNFNLVVKDGAIRIYEWYSAAESFGLVVRQSGDTWQDYDRRKYQIRLIIAKDGKDPVEHAMLGLSFSKKMSEMTSDYPELAEKIKSKAKGHTYLDMFDVIQAYNDWKKSKE